MPTDRILVVDDDPELQEYLRTLLESEGYGVDFAFNGREALSFLREGHRPSAILLDLMMPVMNGYEFLAALQDPKTDPFARKGAIPTIVVSAAQDSVQTSTRLGFPLVRKPFDIDVLLGAIKSVLTPSVAT